MAALRLPPTAKMPSAWPPAAVSCIMLLLGEVDRSAKALARRAGDRVGAVFDHERAGRVVAIFPDWPESVARWAGAVQPPPREWRDCFRDPGDGRSDIDILGQQGDRVACPVCGQAGGDGRGTAGEDDRGGPGTVGAEGRGLPARRKDQSEWQIESRTELAWAPSGACGCWLVLVLPQLRPSAPCHAGLLKSDERSGPSLDSDPVKAARPACR